MIPKPAEKFLAEKEEAYREANSKNSYEFQHLLNLKARKKLRILERSPYILESPEFMFAPQEKGESEEEIKISKREKLQNTLKRFSESVGGLNFMDIPEVEKLFQDGILKYTFYKEIKAGDHFGDLGIIRDKPRSATIICKEDCSFGTLAVEDFKSIFAVVERRKFDKKLEFFKDYFIKRANEGDLVKFVYAFEKRKLVRNEILYHEGDKVNEVYLMKKGEVQVDSMKFLSFSTLFSSCIKPTTTQGTLEKRSCRKISSNLEKSCPWSKATKRRNE